jgi:hypothetical protein
MQLNIISNQLRREEEVDNGWMGGHYNTHEFEFEFESEFEFEFELGAIRILPLFSLAGALHHLPVCFG